ncbi:MAG: hypothetical protein ACRD8U_13445 [Pyrinomonadaceae bacterium]
MDHHFKFVLAILALTLFALTLGCEVDTQVALDGRNPPTFSFKGTGYLTFFTVEEIAPENQNVPDAEQDREKNRTIWSILAISNIRHAS